MKHIYRLLTIAYAVCLLTSCAEETLGLAGSNGDKVTLSLQYSESTPRVVRVSRTAATTAENALNNLQVFVFDENGKLKGYKYIGDRSLLKQDGSKGTVDIKTTTGDAYIYAVANVPTSLYTISSDNAIPTTVDDAWNEDKAQAGDIDFTLNNLKKILFNRAVGDIDITEANFMMSGSVNNGALCTISRSGNITTLTNPTSGSDDAVIKLHRIVSKVKFRVTAGSGVTFTPTKYDICNIPISGSLIEDGTTSTESTFTTYTNTFSAQDTETENNRTYNTFTVYLPENLQQKKNSETLSSWEDREADNGTEAADKVFTNAPDNGTYLVLYGNYSNSGGTIIAETKYFIHLGDFRSANYDDFNVERNCYYIYTVTITGVNSLTIDSEIFKDEDGSGEGIVLNLKSGTVHNLDSHYGKVDITFNKSDISKIKVGETWYDGIYFLTKDIRGTSGICAVYIDGSTVKVDKGNTGVFSGDEAFNADWLEFREGSDQDYPGKGSSKLKSLVAVLKELLENRNNTSFWGNSAKTYTCFVNENFYDDRHWNEFVNKDQRYMYIARELTPSTDGRTLNGNVIYGIRQRSIQTFYDLAEASTINAYGCETNYDDNYENHSSNTFTAQSLCWGDKGGNISQWAANEEWNGHNRMLGFLGFATKTSSKGTTTTWSRLRNSDSKGYDQYRWARFACMSRNRDNNGDGVIDADEVRWYAPTIQQYIGMYIGKDALEPEARLFNGNTNNLNKDWYWLSRKSPALHYWSSTTNLANFIYWAEEGLALGNRTVGLGSNSDAAPCAIRCVRNLPKDIGASGAGAEPDKYYTVSEREFNLTHMYKSALRTIPQETELIPHTEADPANKPAQKFVVAQNVSASTTSIHAAMDEVTVCSQYTEGGYKWRAPNLMELGLINVVLGDEAQHSNDHRACRTHFSNTNFRYSWIINDNNDDGTDKPGYIQMNGTSEAQKPDTPVVIRCVRDIE